MEYWKVIDEFPGYSVSVYGDVMNNRTGRVLSAGTNQDGYEFVILSGKYRRVHRLVATAFIHTDDYTLQVNHLNGNKSNNHSENLEWCTASQNQRHAFRNGLFERNGGPIMIVETGEIFETQKECADAIGGHQSAINLVLQGKRKHHLGLTFTYV